EHLLDVGEPRILLRLEVEDGVADDLRLRGHQLVDELRLHVARPGPAPDVLDRGIVDRDDGDLVARRLRGHLHAEVVCPALDVRDDPRHHRDEEERNGDGKAQEPIGLPETGLHDPPKVSQPARNGAVALVSDGSSYQGMTRADQDPISTSWPTPCARASLASSAAITRSC